MWSLVPSDIPAQVSLGLPPPQVLHPQTEHRFFLPGEVPPSTPPEGSVRAPRVHPAPSWGGYPECGGEQEPIWFGVRILQLLLTSACQPQRQRLVLTGLLTQFPIDSGHRGQGVRLMGTHIGVLVIWACLSVFAGTAMRQ